VSYRIQPAEEGSYIHIEVQGTINRAVGVELIIEAHSLGDELGIENYFMDLTQAVNDDTVSDQFHFANTDMAETPGLNRYAKVAALVAPEDHSHDFIETVLRNVGFNLRIFRCRSEAMAFLGLSRNSERDHG